MAGKQIRVSSSLTFLPESMQRWTPILRTHLARDFTVALLNCAGPRQKSEKLKLEVNRKEMAQGHGGGSSSGSQVQRPAALLPAPSLDQIKPQRGRGSGGLPSCLPVQTVALTPSCL